MRKLAILMAPCAIALGLVSVAQAVDADQGLKVKVSGQPGTKKKPSAIKLGVTTTTTGKGSTPDGTFGTTNAVIHFDKNLVFNYKQFPTCTNDQVVKDASKCPKGAKVSVDGPSSQAQAQGGTGPSAVRVTPAITAYNGPKGTLILKLTAAPGQIDVSGTIVAKIKRDSGAYGAKLVVPIPEKFSSILGLKITLQKFATLISAKTKVKGKTVSYVASVGCGSAYRFAGDFTYTDGTSLSATTTAPCR